MLRKLISRTTRWERNFWTHSVENLPKMSHFYIKTSEVSWWNGRKMVKMRLFWVIFKHLWFSFLGRGQNFKVERWPNSNEFWHENDDPYRNDKLEKKSPFVHTNLTLKGRAFTINFPIFLAGLFGLVMRGATILVFILLFFFPRLLL